MSNLTIKPHTGTGVEILGVDLAELSGNQLTAIQQAYAEHGLVFFRDQKLTEQQHIELAERFGQININRRPGLFHIGLPFFPKRSVKLGIILTRFLRHG